MQLDEIVVFPWSPNFDTGIEEIDAQHKRLVELLNRLANTLVYDNPIKVVSVFDELTEYAAYHFEQEEMIWQQYFSSEDSWATSHMLSHASFLPKVLNMKDLSDDKPWQEVIEDILQFLIRWLSFHILDEDKKMSFVLQGIEDGMSFDEAKITADKRMSGSIRVLIDTVLSMYDNLSSHALDLIREKHRRIQAEQALMEANARLEQLSITDELTGLYNRRYFNDAINKEIQRAAREKRYISFISLDLDHFKELNDKLGHLKGDEALSRVGDILRTRCKRAGDLVFRMGGEELLVVVSGLNKAQTTAFAESIRDAIAEVIISKRGVEFDLTTSAGVFTHIPQKHDRALSFLEKSDKALYMAKKEGRNRVVSLGLD